MDEPNGINERAWDRRAREGESPYTRPVTPVELEAARRGDLHLHLGTPKRVPPAWLPDLENRRALCLAAGGGQQGPLLAAAGAQVTVFDLSTEQLAQDRKVAKAGGLDLETVQGTMQDLSCFPDGRFDLILHPVSNCFVPEVAPVWRETYRVLRPGGTLLSAFANPILYAVGEEGTCLQHVIPYSDLERMSPEERERHLQQGGALEFGHSLDDLLGGQIAAGFLVTGFYEDRFPGKAVDAFLPPLMATRALKPA